MWVNWDTDSRLLAATNRHKVTVISPVASEHFRTQNHVTHITALTDVVVVTGEQSGVGWHDADSPVCNLHMKRPSVILGKKTPHTRCVHHCTPHIPMVL